MAIKLGNTDISDIKLGDKQVLAVYIGDKMVWEKATGEDADYLAFINATVITDSTQKSAVNYLVTELKVKGLWQKMIAIYPFVGGNANSHKFNLKNPQDYDAAFRLIFSSITHSANGIQYGYSDTKVSNANVNPDSFSVGFYSRTNLENTGVDIGASAQTANNRLVIHSNYSDGNGYFDAFNATSERIVKSSIGNSLGLYILSRSANNLVKAYKNGVILGSNTNTRTNMFSGNILISGTGTGINITNRNYAFAFVGSGLSDADAVNLNTIVQQYQTMLGRQV